MSDTLPPDLRELLIRIDTRLGAIVTDIAELKADTKAEAGKTREDIVTVREGIAFVRGRLENIPTFWQTATIAFGVLIGLPVVASVGAYVLHIIGRL